MNELEQQFEVVRAAGVAGLFPECFEVASNLSLSVLATPERLWRFMLNNGTHWTMVSSYWRRLVKGKGSIILATNPGLVPSSSLYAMELEFLRKLGYSAHASGTRLDFGGGINRESAPGKLPATSLNPIQAFLRTLFRDRMKRALKADGRDTGLEEAVRQGLGSLFRNSLASVVSNVRLPRVFGNAVLVVAADTVLIRIVRDRDELRFDVAPASSPGEWKLLPVAIAVAQGNAQRPVLASCVTTNQCGALLEDALGPLRIAFSPENYSLTRASIEQIEKAKRDEWVEKFNQTPIRRGS